MKIIIKKSGKKGKGVFANKDFKKGGIIIHGDFTKNKKFFTKKEFHNLSDEDQNHLDYIGHGKYVVDYSHISLVNHSCSPNCYVKYRTLKIKDLVALRDIKKGEEITFDYAVDADTNVKWKLKCYCKSKNCRKTIYSDYFKLPKKLQRELWKYVPVWKKRALKRKLK